MGSLSSVLYLGAMSDSVLARTDPWIYFDGNAITALWDWHTAVHPHGKTGDSRERTPFQHAVLSDFSLSEIITNPIDNAYLKHVVFLTIFPDLPVLRPLDGLDIGAAQRDRSLILNPPDFLPGVIPTRLLAAAGHPEAVRAHEQDLAGKQKRIQEDIAAAAGQEYVPVHLRKPLGEVIDEVVALRGLRPSQSAVDFFELCKHLFGCERTRYIDRPTGDRKTARRYLNLQIDYYHLSYLPFVDGFVTDDAVLRDTATDLVGRFYPRVHAQAASSARHPRLPFTRRSRVNALLMSPCSTPHFSHHFIF